MIAVMSNTDIYSMGQRSEKTLTVQASRYKDRGKDSEIMSMIGNGRVPMHFGNPGVFLALHVTDETMRRGNVFTADRYVDLQNRILVNLTRGIRDGPSISRRTMQNELDEVAINFDYLRTLTEETVKANDLSSYLTSKEMRTQHYVTSVFDQAGDLVRIDELIPFARPKRFEFVSLKSFFTP